VSRSDMNDDAVYEAERLIARSRYELDTEDHGVLTLTVTLPNGFILKEKECTSTPREVARSILYSKILCRLMELERYRKACEEHRLRMVT